MDKYEEVKLDYNEVEKAKKTGKRFLSNKWAEVILENARKKYLEEDESIDMYFWGENIDNITNKMLIISVFPYGGLYRNQWKMNILLIKTNKRIYLINANTDLEEIDSIEVEKEDIKEVNYYKNNKLNILELKIGEKIYTLTISKKVEEIFIEDFIREFSGKIINGKYSTKKIKFLKYSVNLLIIITILAILIKGYQLIKTI